MEKIEKVLIVGLGAIGAVCAAKIFRFQKHALKILVDEKRFLRYKSEKTEINDEVYDFDYILPTLNFKADLIIVSTKNDGLEWAVKNIKNFVSEDTIILSLLNGISSEEKFAQKYNPQNVLYSFYLGQASMRKGRKIYHSGADDIYFGEMNNKTLSKNVQLVADFFEQVGIAHHTPIDMKREYWKKFMLNIGVNQTSAIFKATYRQIRESKEIFDFMRELMLEVQDVAKKAEVNNAESLYDEAMAFFARQNLEGKTSMFQDIEAGRKTEVDIFAGEMLKLGKKYQVPTPFNEKAFERIKQQENKLV